MWDDEGIEAAIDEVARQMTAGEPDGAFRARVMARIDTRRRPMPLRQALVAAIAAAAAIAIAVIVWLRPTQTAVPAHEARSIPSSVAAAPAVSLETIPLRNEGPTRSRTARSKAGTKDEKELDSSDRLSV